jgi:O-antigen/teichoic acid export membrane protein
LRKILRSNLFRNFSYVMIADLSVKLISFVIIYKLATILGPEYYGKYALTISLIVFHCQIYKVFFEHIIIFFL